MRQTQRDYMKDTKSRENLFINSPTHVNVTQRENGFLNAVEKLKGW